MAALTWRAFLRVCLLTSATCLGSCGSNTVSPDAASADIGRDQMVHDGMASETDGPSLKDGAAGEATVDADGPVPCTALVNDAVAVTEVFVATDMPTAIGGTIVAGDYHKVAVTRYTGPGGMNGPGQHTERTTAHLAPDHFEFVTSLDGGPDDRSSGVVTTSGPSITLDRRCPGEVISSLTSFDAHDLTIVLYDPIRRTSFTYTR